MAEDNVKDETTDVSPGGLDSSVGGGDFDSVYEAKAQLLNDAASLQ
jgi:hypothetical protein